MAVGTRPLRQEVAYLPPPPEADFARKPLLCSDTDIGCYMRSDVGGRLLVGGQEPACDPLEWVDDPDDWNEGLTDQWTAQVYRAALRIPTLPIPGQATGIAALYDVSDDWIPIYDRSSLPGFYMACGTSGNQFKNAPVAGMLMAELIDSLRGRPRPRRGPAQGAGPAHRPRARPRLLLAPPPGQPGQQLHRPRLRPAGQPAVHFFRNEVRAAPASFCASAWLVQPCCRVEAALMAGAAAPPFRHWLMKLLRPSPFRFFAEASALQFFIFICWAVICG